MPGTTRVSHVLLCYDHTATTTTTTTGHKKPFAANTLPWFASCLTHKGQPELTSVLEASKIQRAFSGMQVEEGLKKPCLQPLSRADGPTRHQAVPTLLWPEWGPIPLLSVGPFCSEAPKATPRRHVQASARAAVRAGATPLC